MIDKVFEDWKKALESGERIEETSNELFKVLERYANGVVQNTLNRQDPTLSHNIVVQTFLKAGTYQGMANFGTWFYRLAYNMCVDELRRIKRRREVSLEDLLDPPVAPEVKPDRILSVLARLPRHLSSEDFKFVEAKLSGYTSREVGEKFGLSLEGARTRWVTIRKRIRKLLEAPDVHSK